MSDPLLWLDSSQRLPRHLEPAPLIPTAAYFGRDRADLRGYDLDARTMKRAAQIDRGALFAVPRADDDPPAEGGPCDGFIEGGWGAGEFKC